MKIRNATKQGWIDCPIGGVLNIAFPESKLRRGRVIENGTICPTLDTGCEVGVVVEVKQIGNIVDDTDIGFKNPQRGRVYDPDGLSPALNTCGGGGLEPKIAVRACLTPDRIDKRQNGRRFKENGEASFTLNTQDRHGVLLENGKEITIRKLMPIECFRLQGWTDDYFRKAEQICADSQLYKQAGNGVTVNVIRAIAERLPK